MNRRSVLHQVRDLAPVRPLTVLESCWVAEHQAGLLLKLAAITEPPVPETVITELPRLIVRRAHLTRSAGGCRWLDGRWCVLLNADDCATRQRFSLCHEAKHIIDHGRERLLYPPTAWLSASERAERVCEYFAACLLMPRAWVRRAWTTGLQDIRELTEAFDVSRSAMTIRLSQLGLREIPSRCGYGRSEFDRSGIDIMKAAAEAA